MKKTYYFVVTVLVMAFATSAFAQRVPSDERLLRLVDRTALLVERNLGRLTPAQKLQIQEHLGRITRVVRGSTPPPYPHENAYCAASCQTISGGADKTTMLGARANSKLRATDLAIAAVRETHNCAYGIKLVECVEHDYHVPPTTCTASCSTISGGVSMSSLAYGEGFSELEAKVLAYNQVSDNYTCSYGIADHQCSAKNRQTYCSAACATISGGADRTYSAGAYGDNELQAKVNAFNSVKERFNCTYGMRIVQCGEM